MCGELAGRRRPRVALVVPDAMITHRPRRQVVTTDSGHPTFWSRLV